MKTEEERALAALYATWDTADITDAITRRCAEFAPRALEIMAQELRNRDASVELTTSGEDTTTRQPLPSSNLVTQSRDSGRPYIQYVGAWGLNILLSTAMGFPVWLIIHSMRPHGQSEALVMTLMSILLALCVSLSAFWLSVKWMIVDRLQNHIRTNQSVGNAQH
jgi:hypothetical protein